MPLMHSSSPRAFKQNVRTLMGEVGKSPHVQSPKQALAIAYAQQRRGKADGGAADYHRALDALRRAVIQQQMQDAVGISDAVPRGDWRGKEQYPEYPIAPYPGSPIGTLVSARGGRVHMQQGGDPGPAATPPMPSSGYIAGAGSANTTPTPGGADWVSIRESPDRLPFGWVHPPASPQGSNPASTVPQPAAGTNPAQVPYPQPQSPVAAPAMQGPTVSQAAAPEPQQPTPPMGWQWWGQQPPANYQSFFPAGISPWLGPSRTTWAAGGGLNPQHHSYGSTKGKNFTHHGPISSHIAGRTDRIPMAVKGGSYVFPADFVSSIGGKHGAQGNTSSGFSILNHMFGMGPYGTSSPHVHGGSGPIRMPSRHFAEGGEAEEHGPVDIITAGGEYVLPTEKIIEHFGDVDRGHKILDDWVMKTRKENIGILRKLPRPKTT